MNKNIVPVLLLISFILMFTGCLTTNETPEPAQPVKQVEVSAPVQPVKEKSLQELILQGNSSEARDLFQTKVEVNGTDENGDTALHAAAKMNDGELVNFLILRGADTEMKNLSGDTPIHVALKNNASKAVAILAEYSNIFSKDASGKTALELALAAGNKYYDAIITPKIASTKDAEGRTIVHYFAENLDTEAMNICIMRNVDLSVTDNEGNSPLSICYEKAENLTAIKIAASLLLSGAAPLRTNFSYFEDAVKTRNPSMRFDDGQTPLHYATILGHTGVVQYLIERGAVISAKDVSGSTALHEAVRYGRTEIAGYLLAAGADANAQDSMGKTPMLIMTPSDTRSEIYTMLLKAGSNPNAKDLYGDTPLHIATLTGMSVSTLEQLVKAGADIDERNKKGVTPLSVSVENKWTEHIAFYASCGADIHAEDIEGNTPLTRAMDNGLDILSKVINRNNCSLRDSYGNTPLHIAIQRNADSTLIKYILDCGADVNARNRYGDSPLFLAVQQNFRAAGEMLLARQADVFGTNTNNQSPLKTALSEGGDVIDWVLSSAVIEATDGIGNTPLHYACEWKLNSAVALLLEKGANPNIQNSNGETPLFSAVKANSPSTIQLLLDKGADKNKRDFLGNTALHTCIRWDAMEAAKVLIDNGIVIGAQNISGKTPLHEAAKANRLEMVELLLSNGADINAADSTGKTVLIDAIQEGNINLVKMLIDRGASPHIQEMYGRNAYHEAAESGNIDLINIIREAGGNPLSRDSYGRTPLSLVLDKSDEAILAVLGNDLNLTDSDGNTPIHLAVANRITPQKLSMLLSMHYPVNRRNSTGQTPLSIAVNNKYLDSVKVLLENGADPYLADNSGNCAVSMAIATSPDILNCIVTVCGKEKDMAGDGILHYAARTADAETINRLLSTGLLNRMDKNISGETAFDIAVRWQRPVNIIDLLR